MPEIAVLPERCTRCGACVVLCTGRVFRQELDQVVVADAAACWLCGHCVAVCPADAVLHSEYPLEDCPPLDPTRLPSAEALEWALRARRSARVFQDRPVPREVVRELVEVGRWAPSASNAQPVDWLAVDDPARIAALSTQTVAVLAQTARLLRVSAYPALLQALKEEMVPKFLATRSADGAPNVVPCTSLMPAGDVEDRLIFGNFLLRKSVSNLDADPRVGILVVTPALEGWILRGNLGAGSGRARTWTR